MFALFIIAGIALLLLIGFGGLALIHGARIAEDRRIAEARLTAHRSNLIARAGIPARY